MGNSDEQKLTHVFCSYNHHGIHEEMLVRTAKLSDGCPAKNALLIARRWD